MSTVTLSEAALALLRQYRESGDIPVDDSNREACRELAREGLMVVGHTFTGGARSSTVALRSDGRWFVR